MGKLDGRVALVYGGTSGIGAEVAKLYAKEGAKIAVLGRNQERGEEIVHEIESKDGTAVFIQVDLLDVKQIKQSVQEALDTYGTIDILYNGAGILDEYVDIRETSEETYNKVMNLNVKAPFMATKFAIQTLVDKGKGVVINLGSTATKYAGIGGTPYVASKHAIQGVTRQLSYDFGPKGIKVNCIAPGFIDNPMTEGITEPRMKGIPDRRAGKSEEVAKLALFLASDDSNYMNGTTLYMDGGWSEGATDLNGILDSN